MPNIRVDAAARIKAPSAAPSKLRNTPPPLASNDLFGGAWVITPAIDQLRAENAWQPLLHFVLSFDFHQPAIMKDAWRLPPPRSIAQPECRVPSSYEKPLRVHYIGLKRPEPSHVVSNAPSGIRQSGSTKSRGLGAIERWRPAPAIKQRLRPGEICVSGE